MNRVLARLLAPLENRSQSAQYKPLQRKVLLLLSVLFLGLSAGVIFVAPSDQIAAYFPVLVFGGAGIYGLLVAFFGSDKAVANLWNSNR